MMCKLNGAKPGDVLLRGHVLSGFQLVDAITSAAVCGPVSSIAAAIEIARLRGGAIWQQALDNRGRALADPIRLRPEAGHAAPPNTTA